MTLQEYNVCVGIPYDKKLLVKKNTTVVLI